MSLTCAVSVWLFASVVSSCLAQKETLDAAMRAQTDTVGEGEEEEEGGYECVNLVTSQHCTLSPHTCCYV